MMIDKGEKLPVTRQCDLLDLSRSFVYYTPAPLSAKEMELMLQTAKCIATSALIRKESRGAHYREDFPATDYRNWTKHVLLQKKGGQLEHSLGPVRITRITPPEA